jgi:hypothetical protein
MIPYYYSSQTNVNPLEGANEVIGANYIVTTPFFKPLLIV